MKAFFGNKQEMAEAEQQQQQQQQQHRRRRGAGAGGGASGAGTAPRAEDLEKDAVYARALQDSFDDEHYLFKAKQESQIAVDSRVAQIIQSSDAASASMAETFYADVETSKRVQVSGRRPPFARRGVRPTPSHRLGSRAGPRAAAPTQEELSVEDAFEEANRAVDGVLGAALAGRIDRRENGGIPARKREDNGGGKAGGNRRLPWMRRGSDGGLSFHSLSDLTNSSIPV